MDIKVQPLYGAPKTGSIHPLDIEDKFATKKEIEHARNEAQEMFDALSDGMYNAILFQNEKISIYSESFVNLIGRVNEQEAKIMFLQKRLNFMYTWFSILAVAMSIALAALAFAVK